MRVILAVFLILLVSGCTKEPEPPEVSPAIDWLPSVMNEYDLAPASASKKLPVL